VAEPFLDTNILLCLISSDAAKAARAERLLRSGGVISVQVLNEFTAVARRKTSASWAMIRDLLETFRSTLRVEALTSEAQLKAVDLADRYLLSIYDAQILASAMLAGCDRVYSEDMQDGMTVEGALELRNPFIA
jgi:predicted nucleic acid-binding protein